MRIARKRAGLSQEQLALRSGVHRNVIGRWERGEAEPSLATLRRVVAACELDLVIRLAVADRSLDELTRDQLELTPSERLIHLLPSDRWHKTLEALRWLAGAQTPVILIGDVAAILQGAPQRSGDVHVEFVSSDPFSTETELRAAGFEPVDSEDRWRNTDRRYPWTLPDGASVAFATDIPGTTGFPDLRRSAQTLELDRASLSVAHPRDLLRIADASPRDSAQAQVPGLTALVSQRSAAEE